MQQHTLRVITLGCSKNTVDTEHLLASLGDAYRVVADGPADTILLNTCGFIGDARQESINAILEAVDLKKRGEAGRIVVFGCLSQRYPRELAAEIPEVDTWLGARDLAAVARALGAKVPADMQTRRLREEKLPYAYLKISEGCNRRCSYCAIPLIRGAHRSVPVETLVSEARGLAAEGVRELEIIAQDSTYYGLDLYRRRALGDLLQALSEVDGIEWLRIHYAYPSSFPDDVLDIMADNPKLCKYLDIPLQHISDGVLDRMHRGVDSVRTRQLVSRLRERIPGVVLRTTLIVGFPGETDEDFAELLDFVRWARFERLGAFIYSEEEGTWGAANLKDDVDESVKQARLDALMNLQAEISQQYNLSRVGSEITVLADSVLPDGSLVCRSQGESPEVDGEIIVSGADASMAGKFLRVKIVSADVYDLAAEFLCEV